MLNLLIKIYLLYPVLFGSTNGSMNCSGSACAAPLLRELLTCACAVPSMVDN